jgi:hypothetical protein
MMHLVRSPAFYGVQKLDDFGHLSSNATYQGYPATAHVKHVTGLVNLSAFASVAAVVRLLEHLQHLVNGEARCLLPRWIFLECCQNFPT